MPQLNELSFGGLSAAVKVPPGNVPTIPFRGKLDPLPPTVVAACPVSVDEPTLPKFVAAAVDPAPPTEPPPPQSSTLPLHTPCPPPRPPAAAPHGKPIPL